MELPLGDQWDQCSDRSGSGSVKLEGGGIKSTEESKRAPKVNKTVAKAPLQPLGQI